MARRPTNTTSNVTSLQAAVPKGRKPPPPNETARQRFGRIGQARMVNALHAIRLIGNLASAGYEYTAEDIGLMHSTLQEAIEQAFNRFQNTSALPKLEETFKLRVV